MPLVTDVYEQNCTNTSGAFRKILGRIDTSKAISAIVVVFALGSAFQYGLMSTGTDFYGFWLVPQGLRNRQVSNIYMPRGRHELALLGLRKAMHHAPNRETKAISIVYHNDPTNFSIYATGSPFFYSVFSLLAGIDFDLAYQIYLLISLVLFATGMILLSWSAGSSASICLALAAAGLLTCPLFSELRVMNTNTFQVFLLATVLMLLTRRPRWFWHMAAGLLLAMVAAFKPNTALAMVLLPATWLIHRRFRKLFWAGVGMALGFVAAAGASSICFGSLACWRDFLQTLDFTLTMATMRDGNASLANAIRELAGVNVSSLLLVSLLVTALVVTALRRRRILPDAADPAAVRQDRRRARGEDFLAIGLGCAIMLAASPLAWLHYFLFLLPLLAYLLRPPREGEKGLAGQIARLGTFLALLMMIQIPTSFFGYDLGPNTVCCMVITSLLLMIVLGLAEIWRLDTSRSPQPLDSGSASHELPSPHAA